MVGEGKLYLQSSLVKKRLVSENQPYLTGVLRGSENFRNCECILLCNEVLYNNSQDSWGVKALLWTILTTSYSYISLWCSPLFQTPAWLEQMIAHTTWRDLFYKLAEAHPDCLMLNFTVKVVYWGLINENIHIRIYSSGIRCWLWSCLYKQEYINDIAQSNVSMVQVQVIVLEAASSKCSFPVWGTAFWVFCWCLCYVGFFFPLICVWKFWISGAMWNISVSFVCFCDRGRILYLPVLWNFLVSLWFTFFLPRL